MLSRRPVSLTCFSLVGKPGRFRRVLQITLFVLTVGLIASCASESLSPEERLRATLEAGEREVEARELSAVMQRVDPGYRDDRQRDWRQIRALLAGYFFRHPSIYVISQIERIELLQPDRASVVLFAGLAGSAQEAAGPLRGWRGNLLRLDLEFKRQDEETWLLVSADWRSVTRDDLSD
jgi:hypothetical protein